MEAMAFRVDSIIMMGATAGTLAGFPMPQTTRACAIVCMYPKNLSWYLPDLLVADELWMLFRGRNVCIYFLLGNCKFGSSACVYVHDKTYLPTGRWWERGKKRRAIQFLLNSMDPDEIPVSMPYILGLIDNRLAWATHSIEVEQLFLPSGPQSLETFRAIIDIGMTTDWIEPGREWSDSSI